MAAIFAALLAFPLGSARAGEQTAACPAMLIDAERLVLVLSPDLGSVAAAVQFYERANGKDWRPVGKPKSAVLGKNGMAWSYSSKLAPAGERVKTEGDGRSPAGFYPLGAPFGFGPSGPAGYVQLKPGEHHCVDDPASPHYNQIVAKSAAGGASGEDMGTVPLYRQGLFIDYPTGRAEKGGSCIFVHIWRRMGVGTAGCVALAERDVMEMQRWSAGHKTLIGILPQSGWEASRSCFRGL